MAKKQTKPEAAAEDRVAADSVEPETAVVEAVIAEPAAAEPLTSDDRGDLAGRILSESKPAQVWKPGSCINCGETTTDAVQIVAAGRYHCTRCKHDWTLTDEQAPFRRLARR